MAELKEMTIAKYRVKDMDELSRRVKAVEIASEQLEKAISDLNDFKMIIISEPC